MRNRHVVVPRVPRWLNDGVLNSPVPQTFGEGRGRRSRDVVNVDPGVRTRARPPLPEDVIASVVRAIIAPALAETCKRSIAASGQLAHRQTATAVTGENEIAESRRGSGLTMRAIGLQGRPNLLDVGVQSAGSDK